MQLNMNKFIIIAALCLTCIFMSGCDNDDSPEISPIEFGQRDYTIRYGTTTRIPFTGGGGAYGLTASDPDVLGKYSIDAENHQLVIFPASTGTSTLTVTDKLTDTAVTLRFTVEDFYVSFLVRNIEGKNTNPYLSVGSEIRFVRDKDNSRQVMIMYQDHLAHEMKYRADGRFDITRSEANAYILQMALHSSPDEELEGFSYTMGGDARYLSIFEAYFGYDWGNAIVSKAQPVQQVEMTLTDAIDGCTISCLMQPF